MNHNTTRLSKFHPVLLEPSGDSRKANVSQGGGVYLLRPGGDGESGLTMFDFNLETRPARLRLAKLIQEWSLRMCLDEETPPGRPWPSARGA
jgi:hypothetical protein